MLYVILCADRPESSEIRASTRPEHVAYLQGLGDTLKAAGPFLDENDTPVGSMLIVEAGNLAAAKDIAAGDPFAKAGLFGKVEVRPWKWTINNPQGDA